MGLEDRQLTGLLLVLSFVVESQNRFVHDAGKQGHLLYFLLFGHSSQFILECYRDFGFEKPFLLLDTHVTNVPKLKEFVKFWDFDFGTGFRTLFHAQTLGFCGGWPSVPKTNVFDTVILTPLRPSMFTELELLSRGILGSSHQASGSGIMLRVER